MLLLSPMIVTVLILTNSQSFSAREWSKVKQIESNNVSDLLLNKFTHFWGEFSCQGKSLNCLQVCLDLCVILYCPICLNYTVTNLELGKLTGSLKTTSYDTLAFSLTHFPSCSLSLSPDILVHILLSDHQTSTCCFTQSHRLNVAPPRLF